MKHTDWTRNVLRRIVIPLIAVTLTCLSALADDKGKECSLATAQGKYGYNLSGTIVGLGAFAQVGGFTADRNGNLVNGTGTRSVNGLIIRVTFTGTYTVNPDCTGSASAIDNVGVSFHFDFILVNDGKESLAIVTDPGTILTSVNKKLFADN